MSTEIRVYDYGNTMFHGIVFKKWNYSIVSTSFNSVFFSSNLWNNNNNKANLLVFSTNGLYTYYENFY